MFIVLLIFLLFICSSVLEITKKKKIKERFKCQIELIIDKPKTSYGNTFRGYFEYVDVSISVTKVDVKIIERFETLSVLLQLVMVSGNNIN